MKTVGSFEAKTHFSHLITLVEAGEEIIITRRGIAVAKLVTMPNPQSRKKNLKHAADDIRALRKGLRLDGVTIRELIEDGRRY